MSDLILCTVCARHVRHHERRCPFCIAVRTPEEQRQKGFAVPRGLSRARLHALHAAALATGVAAAACGSGDSTTGSLGPSDAAERDGENRDVVSGDDAMPGSDAASAGDAPSADAAVLDASTTPDATVESGAGDATDELITLHTLYGGPGVDEDIV